MKKSTIKPKDERISAENDRLLKIFSDLDDAHLKLALNLIQNCAFMVATLQDLQETINNSEEGKEQLTSINTYNKVMTNYTSAIKVLSGTLGKNAAQAKSESGLADFMMRKK